MKEDIMNKLFNRRSSLIFLCAALAVCIGYLTLSGVEEIPERAVSSTSSRIVPKPPDSLNYSYKYKTNYFKAGADYSFMDNYLFPLTVKPVAVGDDDVMVALCDLTKIYAPDFKVEKNGDRFTVEHVGLKAEATLGEADIIISGQKASLTVAPRVIDGEACVPVASFMSSAFAKSTITQSGRVAGPKGSKRESGYIAVAHNQEKIVELGRGMGAMNQMLLGKEYGFLYNTYWFEEGNRTMNYRMYVPTTYDPDVPNKLLLLAHGGSRNQDYWFTDTHEAVRYYTPIEEFAEKYGYIIAAPNAYIVSGDYGDTEIPLMFQTSLPQLTEAEKELKALSEKGFMLGLDVVMENFNIDKEKIYLMGNSMGARGTFFLGNKYSEKFKALVPCAMMPNLSLYGSNPYPNLVDKPVLFVAGTEDNLAASQKNCEILDGYLNNFTTYWNPGGAHSTAWARSLEVIFDFLNQHNQN
jgi:predicted esterase